MEKYNIVTQKINSVYSKNKFINKAKKDKIKLYKERINDLEKLNLEIIEKFDFASEVLEYMFYIEKLDYFKKHKYKKITKLETHNYSPEQNKLHFGNKYINTKNCFTIEKAIQFIVFNQSLEQLKTI